MTDKLKKRETERAAETTESVLLVITRYKEERQPLHFCDYSRRAVRSLDKSQLSIDNDAAEDDADDDDEPPVPLIRQDFNRIAAWHTQCIEHILRQKRARRKRCRGDEFMRLAEAACVITYARADYMKEKKLDPERCVEKNRMYTYPKAHTAWDHFIPLILRLESSELKRKADFSHPITKESASKRWDYGVCMLNTCPSTQIHAQGLCKHHCYQVYDTRFEYNMLKRRKVNPAGVRGGIRNARLMRKRVTSY